MDFLEGTRGNYGTEYLILDQITGEKVEWQTLIDPMDLETFQATVEALALGSEGAGLQISDSGLIDGVTPVPTGFLDQMSVGVSADGLQIFGWLPEVLGSFPVAVMVPWEKLEDFEVTL
jgi:hypothetical protein